MQYETKKMVPDEPLDVYSVIRSPEIREYYQKNVKLDIWAQKQLILCSYLPMTQKICMVKQLALQGTEQEKKTLLDACTILEECIGIHFHKGRQSQLLSEGKISLSLLYERVNIDCVGVNSTA